MATSESTPNQTVQELQPEAALEAGLNVTASTAKPTSEAAGHGADAGMMHDPYFWIVLCFVTLFVLFGKKLAGVIAGLLDTRAGRIENELTHARRLRDEAEALKLEYQKKLEASTLETDEILRNARQVAARMVTNAEENIKDMLDRRMQQVMDRIAQQEQQALNEVRDHVVDITISAAKSMIAEHFQNLSSQQMVQTVIGDLDRKVH